VRKTKKGNQNFSQQSNFPFLHHENQGAFCMEQSNLVAPMIRTQQHKSQNPCNTPTIIILKILGLIFHQWEILQNLRERGANPWFIIGIRGFGGCSVEGSCPLESPITDGTSFQRAPSLRASPYWLYLGLYDRPS
jgi:hypothetical protein